MEENEVAPEMKPQMRIFVGGLTPTVTVPDIEKTFSSLGKVNAVEFVRTDGRNFAYMDFQPNSDKALAKLFSTYNGCAWKGGKLKLERAKEHYLARLNREWEEDAKLMSVTTADSNVEKFAEIKKLDRWTMEDMHLRIFFPKLRTVKTLPFKGTGKHKYSFQRIEVPSLPIHFCDCEEHSEPSETASQKYLSSVSAGVFYEKELNIMNNVMNKLFEKENNKMTAGRGTELAPDANTSDPDVNDIYSEAVEIMEMDDDNLVTNFGTGRRDDVLMQLKERETQPVNQVSRFAKLQPSKDELARNETNSQKRQKAGPADASEATANMRKHPAMSDNITEDEFTAILPRKVGSEGDCQESETSGGTKLDQTELNMGAAQSAKGHDWLQKSSWRGLVGEKGRTSFSISHVLPGICSGSSKLPKSNDLVTDVSTTKKAKTKSDVGKLKLLPVIQDAPQEKTDAPGNVGISVSSKCQPSNDGLTRDKANSQKRQKTGPMDISGGTGNEKKHSAILGNITQDEFTAILPQKVGSEGHSLEPESFTESQMDKSQTELSLSSAQSARGLFWLQKSSWRDLVGEKGNTSFSISNVLPGVASSVSSKPLKVNDSAVNISTTAAKKRKAQPENGKSKNLRSVRDSPQEKSVAPDNNEVLGKEDRIQENASGDEQKQPQKVGGWESRRTLAEVEVGEICTFMRSAESEKQYAKTRDLLRRHLKKKKSSEDSIKSSAGMCPPKRVR